MRRWLRQVMRFLVRISSFLSKEISEILRQPRLIGTLILGPFLILLLFGLGYRNQARALRTLFVVDENSPMVQEIDEYGRTLGPQLIFMGVSHDLESARQRVAEGSVDVVAQVPDNAAETIRNNEQAVFVLYHNEIDPYAVDYVSYFGQVYVDEVNRRVLQSITSEGQSEASNVQEDVAQARRDTAALREALERGDQAVAQQRQGELSEDLSALELALGASLGLLSGVEETVGGEGENNPAVPGAIQSLLLSLRENNDALGSTGSSASTSSADLERVRRMEEDLAELETMLTEFRSISPTVLVSPFRSETQSIAQIQPSVSDYFAPSVIVLLLQHLAVTFAALTIVREQQLGAMELFRVAPITAMETLISKYLSYMLFGALLAIILTVLVVFALGVPMLGPWGYYATVVATLLFTSLGFGFVISLLSRSDSQAVQFTMILLLASVFFTGFMLSLDMLWEPVRVVSWALPATYGINLLQNVMLRGYVPAPLLLTGLAGMGVLLFIIAWLLLRKRMSRIS